MQNSFTVCLFPFLSSVRTEAYFLLQEEQPLWLCADSSSLSAWHFTSVVLFFILPSLKGSFCPLYKAGFTTNGTKGTQWESIMDLAGTCPSCLFPVARSLVGLSRGLG